MPSIRYFRVTQGLQSMRTDGSRVDISGDVHYFHYLSIGLDVIDPTLCFLKKFEISPKFRNAVNSIFQSDAGASIHENGWISSGYQWGCPLLPLFIDWTRCY